jgi:hypothetical protein
MGIRRQQNLTNFPFPRQSLYSKNFIANQNDLFLSQKQFTSEFFCKFLESLPPVNKIKRPKSNISRPDHIIYIFWPVLFRWKKKKWTEKTFSSHANSKKLDKNESFDASLVLNTWRYEIEIYLVLHKRFIFRHLEWMNDNFTSGTSDLNINIVRNECKPNTWILSAWIG